MLEVVSVNCAAAEFEVNLRTSSHVRPVMSADLQIPEVTPQSYRLSRVLRRCAIYVIAGAAAVCAVLIGCVLIPGGFNWRRAAPAICLFAAIGLCLPVCLLHRVRVDARGIWKRRLWFWDLWPWERFASGLIEEGATTSAWVDRARPFWRVAVDSLPGSSRASERI